MNAVTNAINEEGGFYLMGWFKPSKTEDDLAAEMHSMHVIRIEPVESITATITAAKYAQVTEAGTVGIERTEEVINEEPPVTRQNNNRARVNAPPESQRRLVQNDEQGELNIVEGNDD